MAEGRRGPWLLEPNRVRRFYRGGALLDEFRAGGLRVPGDGAATGRRDDGDGDTPEDWVGSTTRSWVPPGEPATDEGLSEVLLDGRPVRLEALLRGDGVGLAGAFFGRLPEPTTGVLVKLLDAGVRLPVHAHPSRAFARRHLARLFGKTEAWIVLATRELPGEPPPHVRLGFRRPVEREELREMIERRQTDALLDALHARPVRPGDVWLVPSGVPHAIGAGILLAEVQEPADMSIVAELAGVPIDPRDAHLGRGWETMLDAFDRRGWADADIDALHASVPEPAPGEGLRRTRLLPPAADPYFRAERWSLHGEGTPEPEDAFLVGIVTGGTGRVRAGRTGIEVRAGMTFAVPAAGRLALRLEGDGLELIACTPPRPATFALDDPGDGADTAEAGGSAAGGIGR